MTQSFHGLPCWYELTAADLPGAKAFYSAVLGWSVADSGMPGMDYWVATTGDTMVAGMMAAEDPAQPKAWLTYFAADNCDETTALAASRGATVIVPPTDIPNTGRFSILTCPQGAGFGLLQPLPGGTGGAFNPQKSGHVMWHDIVTADPAKALEFYSALFGWTVSRTMQMGPDMTYHVIARDGLDIGGAFAPSPPAPSYWKPYFGVVSAKAAMATVTAAGGKILRGPDEVPGGAFTLQGEDAQGIRIALVGPA